MPHSGSDSTYPTVQFSGTTSLCNGQVWQQQSFRIKVSFKIRPSVLIYEDVFGAFRMKVEGIADTISVVRLE